jgi:phenylalanyl-tRNA synthetase beta chain
VEPKISQWKAISKFPSTDLDLAFIAEDSLPADKLDKAIRQVVGGLLIDANLFDVYRGAGVTAGSRSLAYRLRLQAPDRTLTDTEIATLIAKVTAATAKLGAALRSGA